MLNQANVCSELDQTNQRSIIADCLNDLGLKKLSYTAFQEKIGTIEFYLSIIVKEAIKRNKPEVLERLYFAGLVYG